MKPSDERKKFILEFLSAADDMGDNSVSVIPNLFTIGLQRGFSADQLRDALISMDNHHDFQLNIEMVQTLGQTPAQDSVVLLQRRWVNQSGDDFLYTLQHPVNETTSMPNVSIQNYTNNGQTAIGDNATLTSDYTSTVDNSIQLLLSVESQLTDESDKEQLRALAVELETALKSNENPKPKFLSRFKSFADKTWKITGPIVSPLLVELGKRVFF